VVNTPSSDIGSSKRVLIVTYYWPPSGGAGVQRFLKFAKYLPGFGVEPFILTCSNPTYPIVDASLLDEVAESLPVFKAPSMEPFRLYSRFTGSSSGQAANPTIELGSKDLSLAQRFSRWVRANIFIPDARVGWIFSARRKARDLINEHKIDTIITTGPPHSSHFIGAWAAKKTGAAWIADFRDPWTDIHYNRALPRNYITRKLDRRLEKKILTGADAVTVTAPGTAEYLKKHHKRQYHVITNGYDPDDFEAALPETGSAKTSSKTTESHEGLDETNHPSRVKLVIRHVGSVTETSVPENLLKALSGMRDLPVAAEFIGYTHPAVKKRIASYGLQDSVTIHPYLPHKEAVSLMIQADVNVVVVHRSDDSRILIPGKLFDYLKAGKPVMVIGPPDGDAASIVQKCSIGKAFDYDDADGPADWLRKLLKEKQQDEVPAGTMQADKSAIETYSRRHTTRRLAGIIHQIQK